MTVSAKLIDLIGLIYDSVIDPGQWNGTLTAIRYQLRMHNGVLAVNNMSRSDGYGTILVADGISDSYLAIAFKYPDETLALWGGPQQVAMLPLEEPVLQSHATDPRSWRDNAYYREFIEPQGIIDALGIGLARDRTMIANMTFGRHRDAGPITESEVDDLRVLAPHVRRATIIGGMLDRAILEAQTFAAALEASPAGIILVDPGMRVVHANAVARQMLAAEDPAKSRSGVLTVTSEVLPGQLEAAVLAASTDAPHDRRGLGVPARREDGTPVLLRVLPLARRSVRSGLEQRATAAVFIGDAPSSLQLPGDALALLYSLTPAEVRVMELIAAGQTLREVGEALGKSVHTIRTHLNRVFDKTGAHRQADLVRLVSTTTL
jgi:DNA-binding CsgD family transcriptional regulator